MFDNPRKELERLQQELLAAEAPEEPEEVPPQEPGKPEKKHFVGLKFAIALEMLAIAGLFFWWYLWIR